MKFKKFLSSLLSASMVIATMAVPVFADDEVTVTDNESFLNAIADDDNANKTIKFANDIAIDKPDSIYNPGAKLIKIPCTIDLNDYTLDLTNVKYLNPKKDTTIKNGKIKFKNTTDGIIALYHDTEFPSNDTEGITFNLSDVEFEQVSGYEESQCYYLIAAHRPNCVINITDNCKIENVWTGYGVVCANNTSNTKINVKDSVIKTSGETAMFAGEIVIDNSTIESTKTAIKFAEGNTIIKNGSVIKGQKMTVHGTKGGNIYTIGENTIEISSDNSEDNPSKPIGAMIGDTYYTTLAEAFAGAADGDTIKLCADGTLNGGIELSGKSVTIDGQNTYKFTYNATAPFNILSNGSLTVKNAELAVANPASITGAFVINPTGKMVLDNVEMNVDGFNANIFYNVATLEVKNSEITVKNTSGLFHGESNATLNIENSTVNAENVSYGVRGQNLTANSSEIKADCPNASFAVSSDFTLDNSSVTIGASRYHGISGGSINLSNNSKIKVSDCAMKGLNLNGSSSVSGDSEIIVLGGNPDISMNATATLTVDESSKVVAHNVSDDDAEKISGVKNIIMPTEIEVAFDETDKANEYIISIKAHDDKDIYEFVGAQLTFKNESKTLTGNDMDYVIEPIENSNINVVEGLTDDKFAFYLKDGAVDKRITSNKIQLAKVVFGQQGVLNFKATDGVVKTTLYGTHLEEEYVLDGNFTENGKGFLDVNADKIDSTEVKAAERDVIVNIAFNHAIARVNDIKVTIRDAFGNVKTPTATMDADGTTQLPKWTFTDVAVGKLTVTLEADGFRKYVYTTNLEEGESALVLNFWNNTLRDEEAAVEEGGKKMNNNFVVGDIAMDYIVDKFDLAAVTSYFGKYDFGTETEKYNRYDLNRDGKIDITDVGYVLHNFGF